jgi:SAM-dependent methyltransferase
MKLARTTFYSLIATALVGLATAQPQPKRTPDVVYVPTTDAAVDAMLTLADVKKTDVVYDLGCGDGRIVITAAKKYGARGVGIDIDPQRIAEARENAKKAGVEHLVRFEEDDLFLADIKEATIVTLFLLSQLNLKLKPKLLADLKPGTPIISNTFDMGDWKAEKEVAVNSNDQDGYSGLSNKVFRWTVPARGSQPK